jgi:serine/threonine protein kinase
LLFSLKPENVLIHKNGYVKLTDFGLSSQLGSHGELQKGVVCGTPEYLAPEVVKKTAHGIEVDWWALGCLIYEMVVGKTPFESKNRGEMFSKIANE